MSAPQILINGLVMGESPRWHENRLWFSDWGAREIIAVDLDGKREKIADVNAFPFSIDFLPDGSLVVVADKLLKRRQPDGSLITHADLTGLSRFAWNEIVVDGRGNIYLNNIGFSFPDGAFAPGIIALVGADGSVRQVADGLAFPNGMAVTPDNRTLIVAESYGQMLTAFDIGADGGLSNRRVFADLSDDYPDGICIDAENAVWYASVPNKRCVRVRERGEILQTVNLDRGGFACMLGGKDGKTLFMVANEWGGSVDGKERTGQVIMIPVSVPGAGWP
ncbi:Sugar lactone lactonase YvrE [Mesorhizobium albiziae]|uniref:Sugar lactone lactonase YvrE n=1 Tax=Neomesorhizobium albiziae TaxID=335020 RepID=A0A1I3ZM94_9HYPH|nr:SMP-30/gluconolactonase/LRE family protein [Mesorhizobium albiziae]GLS32257.1 gluconolactonase [Mesorhizobium albiziae]SFK45214.1 Sugar lactone lactonase YvrE [Mesorhizobium albiziae]